MTILVPMCIAVLPALMAMFGALEVRFFLIIYLITYAYIFLKLDYKKMSEYIKLHYLQVIIIVIAVGFVWCMAANHLLSEMAFGAMSLGGEVLS